MGGASGAGASGAGASGAGASGAGAGQQEGREKAQLQAHLGLTPDRAVLALTDEMTRNVQVRDETYAAAKKHFNDREMVELTATIAAYNLVSRFLEANQVDHE